MTQKVCTFCHTQYDEDTDRVDSSDFAAGVLVLLCQGDSALSGFLGKIIGPWMSIFPGTYRVKLGDEREVIVRHDHMMLADRVWNNVHYAELFRHRLRASSYEYPSLEFSKATRA